MGHKMRKPTLPALLRGSHPSFNFIWMQNWQPRRSSIWNTPSDCYQLFLNSDSTMRQKRWGWMQGEIHGASLWRPFHFPGCDELLCSHFNFHCPIIGHHLGLFSAPSSLSPSFVSLQLFSPHALHMHVHGRKSYICCQSPALPWKIT